MVTARYVLLTSTTALAAVLSCGAGPPDVPTHVHAEFDGARVTVSWDQARFAETYDVCRRMEGYFSTRGDCVVLGVGDDVRDPSVSYWEGGATGTTFSYRVRASNAQGTSAWSEYSNRVVH
ncbi:MAG: hypothetical protein HY904_03200 [Deltaproteobacteria bacterium]|nr:hypothetical protein [Deltaproteobacteria bacterium]